tara:strand:+ start:509 stop:703 length:195 start_codon:yes stop_codon:yes gene_type:complete
VSNKATKILNKNPERTRPQNNFQSNIPKRHSKLITRKVSINWELNVEKLFLNQSILPFVLFFQK